VTIRKKNIKTAMSEKYQNRKIVSHSLTASPTLQSRSTVEVAPS
jgi:hypothetical protein